MLLQRPRIRHARGSDAEFLVRLSQAVFLKYSRHAGHAMMRMMQQPGSTVIVAEREALQVPVADVTAPDDEDVRLGFAVVHIRSLPRNFGPLERPIVAHLDAIAVRPSVVGQGIGKALLAAAEDVARRHRAISMSLETANANQQAQGLFISAGYRIVTTFDDLYRNGQDGIAMMKSLDQNL